MMAGYKGKEMTDNEYYESEKKRFTELYDRAKHTRSFFYTGFHSPHGVELACHIEGEHIKPTYSGGDRIEAGASISFWGGYAEAERAMVRFGDAGEIGYDEPFPINIIVVEPKQQKYADRLTHRDFLGALVNLGIERDVLGDIIVHDNVGYVFSDERMSGFIVDTLTKVKHTPVNCYVIETLPEDARPQVKEREINVSSLRLDGIVAHVFKLSRSDVKTLFSSEKVMVGGMTQKNTGKEPKEGDIVSVRGSGKFRYLGVAHETKKGHLVIAIEKYV